MTDKPTDEALENLFVEETGFDTDDFPAAIFGFARAVLEKWGTPAPVGAEPVAWAATSEDGVVEALGMNQSRRFDTPLYLAPQPVAREPLSAAQKQHIHNETGAGHALICLVESYLLEAPSIKGGQHDKN